MDRHVARDRLSVRFTLGYSRRPFARGYPNERLATLLDGHEYAFQFGGITLGCCSQTLGSPLAGWVETTQMGISRWRQDQKQHREKHKWAANRDAYTPQPPPK